MAKALFGYTGVSSDLRLAAEIRRLRVHISVLETELTLAHATSDALAASLTVEDDLRTLNLQGSEPALT